MFGIAHIDVLPFVYAIALTAGFFSVWTKITQGLLWIAVVEVTFFTFTFMLHGGSMAGSLAAVISAMAVGFFLKRRRAQRYKSTVSE